MGLFAQAVRPRVNVAFREPVWTDLLAMFKSKSGPSITVDRALQATAVLGCMRVISEDVSQVSRDLFKKRDDGGSDVATDHPLHQLLLRKPNDWQTGFEFMEQAVLHAGMCGRFIAFKNVVRGELKELIPFEPHQVVVERDDRRNLRYLVSGVDGSQQEFPAAAIWHLRGPSWDGWNGLEVMQLAREAIGLSIAAEEAHALLHANGAQTAGIYSVDAKLDEGQYKQLRDWIQRNTGGVNKFRPFILDRGGKFIQTSMTGVDAQHLETRKFQIEEVCRAFRVLPIMIGYSDKTATFASSAEMFAAHVKYTLGGWFRRIEDSINANLLTADEWKQGHYFKFLPISLLRGNSKDRGEFYYRLWQMGALNANEIRAYEELNPYEGGEVYRVPVNMAGTDEEPEEEIKAPPAPGARLNVGRVLSARNERRIRDAGWLLDEVLDELGEETQE